MIVLAGDIGGTQTRIALYDVNGAQLTSLLEKTYSSTAYPNLDTIIEDFVCIEKFTAAAACFGVAGPVQQDHCNATNLPWKIDAQKIGRAIGIRHATLINDLEANAWGIQALAPNDLHVINPGNPPASGNACIISAGTGLGEAGLYWNGIHYQPYASEGGHCDFAASTEQEFRLLKFLQQRYDHVSWERVVSGIGVVNIFAFLIADHGLSTPGWFECDNAAAEISRKSLDGSCALCAETMDLFIRFYAAEAGNLALKTMATGGVYIGGGIAPKILQKFREPTFLETFKAKGRMTDLLGNIPVKVILNPQTALFGSALYGGTHC